MGLFSHKKHHDEPAAATGATGADAYGRDGLQGDHSGAGMTGASGAGTGAGTGSGYNDGMGDRYGEGHGVALDQGATHGGQRGTGNETYGGAPGVGAGQTDYTLGGTGRGAAADHEAHAKHSGGGGAKALEGKIEKGLGTVLNSASLKAKGLEKEREAEALRDQAAHVEEAERLEREARMHREAATGTGGHGHHHHEHAGGVRPAGENSTVPGEQMVNQPGMGAYGGNPMLPGAGYGGGRI